MIAIIFTFPLILKFSNLIPGVNEDSPTHIWYLWWFRWAFVEGHSPLFKTDWIFHPQIIDRIFDVHTFTNAAISLPFQYLFGVIAASNILFYLNFFLTGLGSFLIAKKVTGSNLAAFIGGLIFVFMPYTWGQMLDNHTNLYTVWFIPFYLLFLIKTLEEKKWVNPILAGLIFGLQALNDLTLTSFMILATILVFVYYLIFIPGTILSKPLFQLRLKLSLINGSTISRLVVLGGIFILVFLPLLIPTFQAIKAGNSPVSSLSDQQVWSPNPIDFLTPSGNNPFLKQFSHTGKVNAIEGSVYLGITTLVLTLIAIVAFLKRKTDRKKLGLWFFLFISFLILSIGPCTQIFGPVTHLSFCSGLPLPFVFFHKLPLIGGIQEPVRMQLYTMMALSIMAAFGIKELLGKINEKLGFALVIIVSLIILTEYYTPLPYTDLTPPKIYQTIAATPGDFAVLDLPVGWNNQSYNTGYSPIGSLQYFQAVYHKKAFRATVARIPTQNIYYYLNKPLFKYLAQPDRRIPDQDDLNVELVKKTFKDMGIKYIVFHKDLYDPKKARTPGQSLELIDNVLGAKKVYDDGTVLGYLVPN